MLFTIQLLDEVIETKKGLSKARLKVVSCGRHFDLPYSTLVWIGISSTEHLLA